MWSSEIAAWLKTGKWQPLLMQYLPAGDRPWFEAQTVEEIQRALEDVLGVPVHFDLRGWLLVHKVA